MAADRFFVYKPEMTPTIFTQEFEVAETECGGLLQKPALITYTQLGTALAQNQRHLTFPNTSQEFFVHPGSLETKLFAIE